MANRPLHWILAAVLSASLSPFLAGEIQGTSLRLATRPWLVSTGEYGGSGPPGKARGPGRRRTNGRFSLIPSIGVYQAIRLGSLVPLPHTADVPGVKVLLEPKSPEAGLSLGYGLSRHFELQVEAFAGRASIINDIGIGFAGIPLGKVKVSDAVIWSLGARLLYGFGGEIIEPYLAAGVGITTLDTEEFGAKTRPAVEIGAGLRVRLSERWRAVLDVRDAVSFFRYFEDFRISYVMIYTAEVQDIQHRLSARLGLGFVF